MCTGKSDGTSAGDGAGHVQGPKHDAGRVGADDDARRVAEALFGDALLEVETRLVDAEVVIERQHLHAPCHVHPPAAASVKPVISTHVNA